MRIYLIGCMPEGKNSDLEERIMKILLAAVNAKYIHSNLAVYSLKAYAEDPAVEIGEYTINQQKDDILMDIYKRQPDILCLSCYIWNLDYIEEIVLEIGKLRPDMPIWLGGPEVSYDAKEVLRRLPCVKGVMKGEGEKTFKEICRIYRNEFEKRENVCGYQDKNVDNSWKKSESVDNQLKGVDGITFREEKEKIIDNPWRPIMDLSEVPFVYDHMEDFEHKIIYYETSRGCPFSCSYCLSSVDKRLRFRDIELVKKELQFFLDHKVPQVKFVDRTFNCKHDHSIAIWKYIMEHDNGITNFHFEIAADILNEEELELLEQMRPGLVQLEIGVQSTNPKTIKEIHRVMDFEKVSKIVRRIQNKGNVHEHLDLIAGLPYEDVESFAHSFDDVYALKPEQLQLGFLKVLKGSFMQEHQEEYGIVHKAHPPYEVLYTKWISYEDVLRLKGIEEMVEVYYNSRQFTNTMEELEKEYDSAFTMYDRLASYYEDNGYNAVQHKRSARYEILLNYIRLHHKEKEDLFREVLTYDYYLRENAKSRPEFAGDYLVEKNVARAFYEKEEETHMYLPDYGKYDRNQMRKMTHLEYFKLADTYILFDYQNRNPLNQEARVCNIKGNRIMKKRTGEILELLDEKYGTEFICYLNYETPWQLLIATMLSAQCTDARVNIVTKDLFRKYPSVEAFADADLKELEQDIKPTGFYHNKAKNIIACMKDIRDKYNGEVPSELEDLLSLAGVGRKTANVIRGNIYHVPSVVVDTHVKRISNRLGLTKNQDPDKIEQDLMKELPEDHWILWNIHIITFGRTICSARSPKCEDCFLQKYCKEYKM